MAVDAHALEFIGQLERSETGVLTWGLVDGFFSEEEVEQRADEYLASVQRRGTQTAYESGWSLVEALLDHQLLWKVPETQRYRTRMAETVRLFARLKQIFASAQNDAWRSAPNLVADYRLLVRPRQYPRRDVVPLALLQGIRRQRSISILQEGVVRALIRADSPDERPLARFQARSTERILRATGGDRCLGTVISAGTGSGKTLAFYLAAYAVIAERLSTGYWTKCLALYPRNELLKDQLREALANARRAAPTLAALGKRRIVIGALYGDVPYSARDVIRPGRENAWQRVTVAGQTAYVCPFVRCPSCGEDMAWLESDIQSSLERLVCSDSSCGERVEPDEVRLTRQRMLTEPPDVLFTSTEMLNQRLSSRRFAPLFGIGVRPDRRPEFVLIDEVHAYEGVHGAHVALLMRRWRRASEARPHFVGLSATLADAPRFFGDLTGLGPGDVTEVAPESEELEARGAEYMIALRGDPSSGTSLLSTTIQSLMLLRRTLGTTHGDNFGSRVFAFTDNLDVTNRLYHNLLDAEGWDSSGRRPNPARPGGSLANLRGATLPNARERLERGQNWALVEEIGHALTLGTRVRVGRTSSQDAGVDPEADILVATAALEVGFDDPEVGAVLQHKAPHSAAAFLQRKGRAGRRQEMRPWTVVVLSDYGRDRSAYQSYDQLFSPSLPPRHLPLGNCAVLRMQATFALCDWLARRLPANHSPDPWVDFSQPASEIRDRTVAHDVGARQVLYAQYLRALLEDGSVRDEFAGFLVRALAIAPDQASAIMWEPPRAIMMEAVPTLLRRLERNWLRAGSSELEQHTPRLPLPEFLPRTLFSDLQVPDVAVRLPARGRNAERVESMPIAQALREFSPGRISRRFGVGHGSERHWIAPGDTHSVSIDSFCPVGDRLDLGYFRYLGTNGDIREVSVVRPFAINVVQPPLDVQQSSNSFLEWRSEIVETAEGHEIDLPHGSAWRQVLLSLCIHTHHLGMPIEVRRFSIGATASVGRGRQPQLVYSLQFTRTSGAGEEEPVAVGFAADVDAIQVKFAYPERIYELCQRDRGLLRGLRASRFRDLIRNCRQLDGVANSFQRDWLSQTYLSTITAEALRADLDMQTAESSVHRRAASTTTREVLETILQWSGGPMDEADGDDRTGMPAHDLPRRLQELADLLDEPITWESLHHAASVLWTPFSSDWEKWLRERFKATLGTALVEAAHNLCPRMNAGALALNLTAYVSRERGRNAGPATSADELWLTETTIGGGGSIEEFLARYVEDPRRFVRLVENVLDGSDLESIGEDLARILAMVSSSTSEHASLAAAFRAVRTATSHRESLNAQTTLRTELAMRNIQPTTTLMVSVNTRLLGPGTSAATDAFVAALGLEWQLAEHRLDVDIDSRIFALVKSADSGLEGALGVTPPNDSPAGLRAWRFGVLSNMLWPRGAQVRAESLRAWNPYERIPDCDRLLLLAAVSRPTQQIAVTAPDWFDQLARALLEAGSAELVVDIGGAHRLAEALLRIGAEPIDSEAILVHARVAGVHRGDDRIRAILELPEAFQ
jgi:hypothetical protein